MSSGHALQLIKQHTQVFFQSCRDRREIVCAGKKVEELDWRAGTFEPFPILKCHAEIGRGRDDLKPLALKEFHGAGHVQSRGDQDDPADLFFLEKTLAV